MTFPASSQPADPPRSIRNVGVTVVTASTYAPSVLSLRGMGAFERALFSLGLCLGKKYPIQMITKNVAFEKASVITVIESLVLLCQLPGVVCFCTNE